MNQAYFLYGPSGSGKSTVGAILAKNLRCRFIDLDHLISQNTGKSIDEIFRDDGEDAFRSVEAETLRSINIEEPIVVALGGGALLSEDNLTYVTNEGDVIVLMANVSTLAYRLTSDQTERPLLANLNNKVEHLSEYLQKRKRHYSSFSLMVDTDDITTDEAALKIQELIGKFIVSGTGYSYPVLIANGVYKISGTLIKKLGDINGTPIVSDDHVFPIYGKSIVDQLGGNRYKCDEITFPHGESNKNIKVIEQIWNQLIDYGYDRSSVLIALGGGVVGDMAGFAAASYMRGIPWVNIPTSLLAMVDSSVGGKTGFNLAQGKNLIGSFHHPELVIIDPNMLRTLPGNEIRNGAAEAIKAAIISGGDLYNIFDRSPGLSHEFFEDIVKLSVSIKIQVVQRDPFEKGERKILNYGHTIGHGLEKETRYNLSHGEAVSIGMVEEAKLAEKIGVADKGLANEIASLLSKVGLPVNMPANIPMARLIAHFTKDKKKEGSSLTLALPERIGKVTLYKFQDVDELTRIYNNG